MQKWDAQEQDLAEAAEALAEAKDRADLREAELAAARCECEWLSTCTQQQRDAAEVTAGQLQSTTAALARAQVQVRRDGAYGMHVAL